MRILYGVLSQGQGHINRASVVVRRLRARGHRVDAVLSGDPPPAYLERVIGAFEHIDVRNFVLQDGALARRRTAFAFAQSLPRRLAEVRRLARRLARDRVDLVLTDFEPLTAWAARLAGVPVVGISGQYRITRTSAAPPPARGTERLFARAIMEAWTPPLSRYFAVSFLEDAATRSRTSVVAPIVEDGLLERSAAPKGYGLAYLYSYAPQRVVEALSGLPLPFRVYGLGARNAVGTLTFSATDRAAFLDDLLACDRVILNGSFQGVCEAALLKKPILSLPFAGQYEERFNAHQVERAGLGLAADALSRSVVERLLAFCPPSTSRLRSGDGATETVAALGL